MKVPEKLFYIREHSLTITNNTLTTKEKRFFSCTENTKTKAALLRLEFILDIGTAYA
jgi:hypothetical protein